MRPRLDVRDRPPHQLLPGTAALAPLAEAERRAAGLRTLVLLGVGCMLSGLVAWGSDEHAATSMRAPALALTITIPSTVHSTRYWKLPALPLCAAKGCRAWNLLYPVVAYLYFFLLNVKPILGLSSLSPRHLLENTIHFVHCQLPRRRSSCCS